MLFLMVLNEYMFSTYHNAFFAKVNQSICPEEKLRLDKRSVPVYTLSEIF